MTISLPGAGDDPARERPLARHDRPGASPPGTGEATGTSTAKALAPARSGALTTLIHWLAFVMMTGAILGVGYLISP